MSEPYIILLVVLGLAFISKNIPVSAAVIVLLILKTFRLNSVIMFFDNRGIQIGLVFMMVALLAPIVLGEFGLDKFPDFMKEPVGILSCIVGIAVTIFASQGVDLMAKNPVIVPMTIVGIIAGVVFFKGVPTGPLIASGLTAVLYGLIKFFIR